MKLKSKFIQGLAGALLLLLLLSVVSCRRPQVERVVVTGASTVYPIVQAAGEALRAKHGVEVSAQAGGSTRGFEDCVAGRSQLGAMARELTPEEQAQVKAYPIAYDAVGVAVHGTNSLPAVTTDDLRRIYRKQVKNWSELGGRDLPIVVVHKAEGHATRTVFMNHLGFTPQEMKDFTDVEGGDNAQIIRVVANTPGAIGYVSLGEVIKAAETGLTLRPVKFDGIEPVMANVVNKSYPLFHPLYLVSRAEPVGGPKMLLDFLRTREGKEIIRQGNYVPVD